MWQAVVSIHAPVMDAIRRYDGHERPSGFNPRARDGRDFSR